MPHVNSGSQVKRSGQKNRADMAKDLPQAKARDDLRTAFSGDQNHASEGKGRRNSHLSSRRLRNSDKEPVR